MGSCHPYPREASVCRSALRSSENAGPTGPHHSWYRIAGRSRATHSDTARRTMPRLFSTSAWSGVALGQAADPAPDELGHVTAVMPGACTGPQPTCGGLGKELIQEPVHGVDVVRLL